MQNNEIEMKLRGEEKVYKTILTKAGNAKDVSATQIGQQMLFDEALRILPDVTEWIHKGSARVYRGKLKAYFVDEQFILTKIFEALLFLSGSIYYKETVSSGRARHKSVSRLATSVLTELNFDEAFRFLEIVVDYSKHFGTEKVNEFKVGAKYNYKLTYTCSLSEIILGEVAEKASKAFYPMPMTTLPIPWSIDEDNEAIGGYEDFQYRLIRAHKKNVDYRQYEEAIFESINYIQSTPWMVNKIVLKEVKDNLVAPLKVDFIHTSYPDRFECKYGEIDLTNEEEVAKLDSKYVAELIVIRKQFTDQVALYQAEAADFETAIGKYRALKLAISVAEQYKDEEAIYFPHSYDFRGRVYPIPIGLTPQGSDAVKAMLLYKDVQQVDEEGEGWNWSYLASLFGDDKLPFKERIARGKELIDADYKEADEPYQFLSHQLELQKWVKDPNYICNTRIHLDACNSGSQFTSAITGDLDGCLATNVMPSYNEDGTQDRKDAYLLVAERALELTTALIESAEDKKTKQMYEFFKRLLIKSGRKVCKVPVMVSNYGGTSGGRTEILWNMFRELGVDRKWITRKIAAALSKVIGDSITGTLKGGKAFEGYVHKMNNVIAKQNKPIRWKTSDGFQVTHVKYKELASKQVACTLPGARKSTLIMKKMFSKEVSSTKMRSAISPNYIHSLDAELLRRVALRMKGEGIIYTDWIHDSFGCHPNDVDLMLDITKEEFNDLIRRNPLKELDKQLLAQVEETKASTKGLADISIPILEGLDIESNQIDALYNSDWFFS